MIKYTSACYETTGGTTLTGNIEAKQNSWVLATVTTRSATTWPEGWDVLRESHVLPSSDGVNQRMAFLCKKIEADETVSFTATQESSARIYLNLIAFEDITGFQYNDGTEVYSDTSVIVKNLMLSRRNCPNLVWGCTASAWDSTAPYGAWESSAGEPICLDPATIQSRQANFVDFGTGTESVTFTASGGYDATPYIIDCVEILVDRYGAPADWFEGVAEEIRRLTETTNKKDIETMLEELQGLELSTATYPDASSGSFGNTTTDTEVYTGKSYYGSLLLPDLPSRADTHKNQMIYSATVDGVSYYYLVLTVQSLKYDPSTKSVYEGYGASLDYKYRIAKDTVGTDDASWTYVDVSGYNADYAAVLSIIIWVSRDVLDKETGELVLRGSPCVKQFKDTVTWTPTAVEDYYTISGQSLNRLAAATQALTGASGTVSVDEMAAALEALA